MEFRRVLFRSVACSILPCRLHFAARTLHSDPPEQATALRSALPHQRRDHADRKSVGYGWSSDVCSSDLLPVPYFHVVFTLPHELSTLILQNKRLLYDLLFRTSAATMLELARHPRHLGADIGFLGVLHTWGQNLEHHLHIHYIIPPGGLALDGSRWIDSSRRFFLPVKRLSRVFRDKFCDQLRELFKHDRVQFHGALLQLASPGAFSHFLWQLGQKDWVVYAKPPFGGAEHVLKYLARYTHRVAISNHRLVAFENDRVSFRWRDYAHGGKKKVMTVSADEFLRRFLLHVLPKGLVRIRHFGLFAN